MGDVTGIMHAWRRRRLLTHVRKGDMSINDARRKLGLPPWDVPETAYPPPPPPQVVYEAIVPFEGK